jgi:hypothetical protein
VRLKKGVETAPHQHARPVGGHVHFEFPAHVDDRVGIGRFENVAVLLGGMGGLDRSTAVQSALQEARRAARSS